MLQVFMISLTSVGNAFVRDIDILGKRFLLMNFAGEDERDSSGSESDVYDLDSDSNYVEEASETESSSSLKSCLSCISGR